MGSREPHHPFLVADGDSLGLTIRDLLGLPIGRCKSSHGTLVWSKDWSILSNLEG